MTKLAGDHVMVLVDGYNLTADSNKVAINDSRKMLEVTAFGDAVQNFIPGQRQMSIEHSGYVDAATGRSHPVLKSAELSGVVSIFLGQNAAPVVGDLVYSVLINQTKYQPLPEVGKVIPFTVTFNPTDKRGGWGTTLAVPVTFTNSANGAAVDNGAATSNGGSASLHLLTAAATDRYAIIVEGATDSGFTTGVVTVATFTLNASVIESECIVVSGSVPRYLRWRSTRTSGAAGNTVQIAVTFVRF